MCLVGLQDFYFDLGYEARLHMRLNNSARIIHYFVVVGLLFRCPTTCYKGIQLQESLEKDVVTQRGIGACTPTPRRWYDGLQARNSSKLSFADVFALILCWIPSSIIFILTRFNFTETMFNSYAISLWISQIPSIPSSEQEWIPCSEEIFGESSSVGKTGRKLGTLNRYPRRMQHEDRIRFSRIRNRQLR